MGIASAVRITTDLGIAAASLLTSIATARMLGAEGRGELAVIIGVFGIASLIGNGGLAFSKTYFAAREQVPYEHLLGNAVVAGVVLGATTMLATIALTRVFAVWLEDVSKTTLYLMLSFLPISFVELYLSFLIIGRKRLIASNLLNLSARAVSAIVIVAGVSIHGTVLVAAVLTQSYTVIRLILNLAYMRGAGLLVRPRPDWQTFRQELAFGTKARGNDILQHLNMRVDILILDILSTPKAVGVYSVATAVTEFAWFPSSAVGWVLFPQTAAEGASDDGTRRTLLASRLSLLVTAVVGALLAIFGLIFIPLAFGREFAEANVMVMILVPGAVLYSLSLVLSGALAGRGLPHYTSVFAGIGLLCMVVLDVILIPTFGAVGAAIASSASYAAAGLLAAVMFARVSGTRISDGIRVRRGDWLLLSSSARRLKDFPRSPSEPAILVPDRDNEGETGK